MPAYLTSRAAPAEGISLGHVPNKRKKERERRNLPPEPGPHYGTVPVPTIGDLLASRTPNWAWAYCARMSPHCGHRSAVALAPFAIRWGLDASSDLIRKSLVCARCGHKGAQIITPSSNGLGEYDPFPGGHAGPL